jgi:hypothetical protein
LGDAGLFRGKLDIMNIITTQEFSSITGVFVREMLLSYTLNREGQRISQEAHEEANKDTGADDYDEHAPWQYRMDVGARMQEEGDKMTIDVGESVLGWTGEQQP